MEDVGIWVVLEEGAEERKSKSITKLAEGLHHLFERGMMENTLKALAEKPLPGEPEGNCHSISLAFMTDLIIAGRAQGWRWVQGLNATRKLQGTPFRHSWLEYDGFAIDASEKLKEKPDKPTISIGESEQYYRAKGITKILTKRNATQTRKWILKHLSKERLRIRPLKKMKPHEKVVGSPS